MNFTAQRQVINGVTGVTVVAVVLLVTSTSDASGLIRLPERVTEHTNQDNITPPTAATTQTHQRPLFDGGAGAANGAADSK